ncbi:MAG: oxidoreductase family protein [Spongiibacteraceae bacterium]
MVQYQSPTQAPRPYPQRSGELPWSKEDITPALLSSLLQNRYPGVVVETMEEVQFLDSHTSKLRLKIQLNQAGKDAGIPEDICIKSNYSGAFANVDICQLEAQFYHYGVPKMTLPTVKCYYSDWDDNGKGHGIVILEDLISMGGKFGHSLDANGVDGVASALEGMAHMHSDLWGSPLLEEWTWLPTSMATPIDNDQIRIMQQFIETNLADPKFQAILPQHYQDDPGKLQRGFDALADWEHQQTTPKCINLGDCHQGNTYIKPDGERIWLDWQLVRKGSPWRDLTYFTIGALTVEERRSSERDLLNHYREHLIARGAHDVPSLDIIFENYRRWVIYGMQAWVANMDSWGQSGMPMNERFFTAGEDLDTWKLLLG